jgi:hypothetical protein
MGEVFLGRMVSSVAAVARRRPDQVVAEATEITGHRWSIMRAFAKDSQINLGADSKESPRNALQNGGFSEFGRIGNRDEQATASILPRNFLYSRHRSLLRNAVEAVSLPRGCLKADLFRFDHRRALSAALLPVGSGRRSHKIESPMAITDIIPRLDDKELANLRDNALRLSGSDDARKQEQAAELLPVVEAEIERRLTLAPPKKVAKPRIKKAVAAEAEEVEDDEEAEVDA